MNYRRPTKFQIQGALYDFHPQVPVGEFEVELVKVNSLIPTERRPDPDPLLVSDMKNRPQEIPPIVVVQDEGDPEQYWIMEGHHRVSAAIEAKRRRLWALVFPGWELVSKLRRQ